MTLLGWLLALGCIGFALVNVTFEVTGYFAEGPLVAYASATSVMDWFVVALKLIAAAVALLVVGKRPTPVPSSVLTALVWGAFALLGVYTLGNLVETVGMATGLVGSADQITVRNIGYVLFFLLGAAGYGVLAISYSRRVGFHTRYAVLGMVAGPAVIALLLLAIPALLVAVGLMPT